MFALATTASYPQVPAIREAVYNYLALKALVRVTISVSNYYVCKHILLYPCIYYFDSCCTGITNPPQDDYISSFVLEFHLPFLALRKSKLPYRDDRRKPDGTPLREATNISFLSKYPGDDLGNNDEVDYLYEAEISCSLSGRDHWVWTGYMFVDTYYDNPDNRENVQNYADWDEQSTPYQTDPFTAGGTDLDQATQIPRDYWLRVLNVRVRQVLKEWQNAVAHVKQSIEAYVSSNCSFTSMYFSVPF